MQKLQTSETSEEEVTAPRSSHRKRNAFSKASLSQQGCRFIVIPAANRNIPLQFDLSVQGNLPHVTQNRRYTFHDKA